MKTITYNMEMLKETLLNNTPIEDIEIKEVWIDYGARISSITLVSNAPSEYQILNPRQIKEAKSGLMSYTEAQSLVNEINKRGW